jgi:NAD(P)-dependent dehydrogenase (short-subunit alcohol dehydrogenase family)
MLPGDAPNTRAVVITGALGGIGRCAAERFAADGFSVVGIDVRRADSAGPYSELLVCDLADEDAIAATVDALERSWSDVHCLVNGAGLTRVAPSTELPLSDWEAVHDTTLRGAFLMSRGLFPLLEASSGSIVNISSISARRVLPGRLAYSSAKAGLDALTRSLAVEWAPANVRVNAVAPAWVDSEFLRNLAVAGALDPEELRRKIPMGRLCTETDVVEAIRFLADPERAGFITGQILAVDGGYLHAG